MQHLRIGESLSLAALVDVDQGGMPTPAALDVIVERIVGEIGLSADVPAEGGGRPFEDAIPCTEPGQLLCCLSPKCCWILPGISNPTLHHGTHKIHVIAFLSVAVPAPPSV